MDSSRARESRCHSKARTCATGLRLRSLSNYVHLVDTKFTKWSNFVREAWLIKEKWNKRSCLEPLMNADARRCSARLIGVDPRSSAGSLPPRGWGGFPLFCGGVLSPRRKKKIYGGAPRA